MSTPQTLTQAAAPHHYNLDYRQRPVLNVNDRQLPPPRPSSNVSASFYHPPTSIPPRPASNLSNRQYTDSQQPLHRTDTSQSGSSLPYAHQVSRPPPHSRDSVAHPYTTTTAQPRHEPQHQHATYDDLRRTSSRASQHQRPPMSSSAVASSATTTHHTPHSSAQRPDQSLSSSSRHAQAGAERDIRRNNKSPVDWVAFFNGKVPEEIITIHDDDSPAPVHVPQESHKRPSSTTANNASAASLHVDKRRRTNVTAAAATVATSSSAAVYNEPTRTSDSYSNANTTSADSLNNTTAPTSLGSVGSTGSRLDGPSIGQKRKRSYARIEQEQHYRSAQESSKARPRGYLTAYGNYQQALFQPRKQKEVHVRHIAERHKATDKVDDDDGHYIIHEGSNIGERYKLQNLLGQGTFGKVVRAHDLRTRKEVAVKIIRAVPKVCLPGTTLS